MKTLRTAVSAAGMCAAALFTIPAIADDVPGAKPGDAAMTCDQIGAELAPYAQQMTPTVTGLAQTGQELNARTQKRMAEAMPEAAALTAAATAATADPTGIASRAVGQAEMASQQAIWDKAIAEDKPLADKMNTQMNAIVDQSAPLQANPRIQRLMQLAQEKNCH
jgi:hypothetical protein